MNKDVTTIRLSNFESIEQIMSSEDLFNKKDAPCKPNGLAFLFAEKPETKNSINIDFFQAGNQMLMSKIGAMDSIHEYNPDGVIDHELKAFLTQLLAINQYVFNSSSVCRAELREFAEFDKFDIKQKLERMVRSL
ncbi:conserved hypothetical protein [Vibrio chagasii]|nr:conserved hypothetical protein [Vibrio chagasii]